MADEKLNTSPEENPQPSLFDTGPAEAPTPEPPAPEKAPEQAAGEPPALVRPREGGGYEIIAGHRRQRASELAGFANMPCIVRNMTDDEAILAMTDDNLRHREKILPMEKAQSLKMQVEAISHQGTKMEGVAAGDVGKRSTEIVGERNGMNYKQVQRYIRLTELVPEFQSMVEYYPPWEPPVSRFRATRKFLP